MDTIKGIAFFITVLLSPILLGLFIMMAPITVFNVSIIVGVIWTIAYFVVWFCVWEWMKFKKWNDHLPF